MHGSLKKNSFNSYLQYGLLFLSSCFAKAKSGAEIKLTMILLTLRARHVDDQRLAFEDCQLLSCDICLSRTNYSFFCCHERWCRGARLLVGIQDPLAPIAVIEKDSPDLKIKFSRLLDAEWLWSLKIWDREHVLCQEKSDYLITLSCFNSKLRWLILTCCVWPCLSGMFAGKTLNLLRMTNPKLVIGTVHQFLLLDCLRLRFHSFRMEYMGTWITLLVHPDAWAILGQHIVYSRPILY